MTLINELKKLAAEKAVEQVESGMILGLGTGSTTQYAVIKIGQLWQAGTLTNIIGIPTSERTYHLAQQYNIPLGSLNDYPEIDLAIDGADEVDPNFNVIKGKGGALLREKIIETAAKRLIIVVDDSKMVDTLGQDLLPVEITQFAWQAHQRWLDTICSKTVLRQTNDTPYITDNGNYIIDCYFDDGIPDAYHLSTTLLQRAGIVEHGLFLDMVDDVIVASLDGIQTYHR